MKTTVEGDEDMGIKRHRVEIIDPDFEVNCGIYKHLAVRDDGSLIAIFRMPGGRWYPSAFNNNIVWRMK